CDRPLRRLPADRGDPVRRVPVPRRATRDLGEVLRGVWRDRAGNAPPGHVAGARRSLRGLLLRALLHHGLREGPRGVPRARRSGGMAPLVLASARPPETGVLPRLEHGWHGGALFPESEEPASGDGLPVRSR